MKFGKAASLGAAMAMVMAAGGINVHDTRANIVPTQRVQTQRKVGKKKNRFDDGADPMKKVHSGFTGAQLRKMRKENGVGGRPENCNWAQAHQMNKMHDAWFDKKFGNQGA